MAERGKGDHGRRLSDEECDEIDRRVPSCRGGALGAIARNRRRIEHRDTPTWYGNG